MGSLENIHDQIVIANLTLPSHVKVEEAPETVLVTVQEQRKEEEIAPPAAEVAPVEGEAAASAEGEKAE